MKGDEIQDFRVKERTNTLRNLSSDKESTALLVNREGLFFFSLLVSVPASYKRVRDSNTFRSSYDRSRCIQHPNTVTISFFFSSFSLSITCACIYLSIKRYRGLASYTQYIGFHFNRISTSALHFNEY